MSKIYLYEPINRLVFSFMILMTTSIFVEYLFVKVGLNSANNVIALLSIVLGVISMGSITVYYNDIYNKRKNFQANKNTKYFSLFSEDYFKKTEEDEKDNMLIDRSYHMSELKKIIGDLSNNYQKNKLNCIFLTGNSGDGKSTLLKKFLYINLKNESKYNTLYYRDSYATAEFINSVEKGKINIFILDQIEVALYNDQLKNEIFRCMKCTEKTIFILAFPKENFGNVAEYLGTDNRQLNLKIYYLKTMSMEIDQLIKRTVNYISDKGISLSIDYKKAKNLFEIYCNRENDDVSLNDISKDFSIEALMLISTISKIAKNKKPFVSFFVVGSILENIQVHLYVNISGDPEKLIYKYLDLWVAQFKNEEHAKAILFLLADGKQRQQFSEQDIKNITFYSYYDNFAEELSKNIFVSVRSKNTENKSYILIHDYIANKICEYYDNSSLSVAPNIKDNIRYYKNYIKHSEEGEKNRRAVTIRYAEYNKNYNLIKIMCIILLVIISIIQLSRIIMVANFDSVLINLPNWEKELIYGGKCSKHAYVLKGFLCISSYLTIYYLYNCCSKILYTYSKWLAVIPAFVGCCSVVASFIYPPMCGLAYGLGLFVYGFAQFYLSRKTEGFARKQFLSRFASFVSISVVIMAFGAVYFYSMVHESTNPGVLYIFHEFIILWLYLFLIGVSVWTHIKQEYILTYVGYANRMTEKAVDNII